MTGGASVTMSLSVAASQQAQPFDYQTVFLAADDALYRAKAEGRDRVCVAGSAVDAGNPLVATAAGSIGTA